MSNTVVADAMRAPGSAAGRRWLTGRVARWLLVLLLFLCCTFPTILQNEKGAVLVVVLLLLAAQALAGRVQFERRQLGLLVATLGYTCFGLLWVAYGAVEHNPGALYMAPVHGIYPLLLVAMGMLAVSNDIDRIRRVLVFISIAVISVQVFFLLSFAGLDGQLFFNWMQGLREDVAVVDVSSGSLVFTLPNVNTLMFLCPFLITHFLYARRPAKLDIMLGGVSFLLLLLAGRRAAFPAVGMGLASSLVAGFYVFDGSARKKAAFTRIGVTALVVGLAASAVFVSGLISFDDTVAGIKSMFEFSADESNLERRLQFAALLRSIEHSPVFGMGAGAVASYIRSQTQPWAYELSYVSLIFHFGLVGLFIYLLGVLYLLRTLLQCASNRALADSERASALSFFSGLVSFLVANGTNPYLSKFDYMWVIFIPVAFAMAGFHLATDTYCRDPSTQ